MAGFDADVRIRALAVIANDHSSWSTYIAGEILQSESRHELDLAEIAWSSCGNNAGANGSSSDFHGAPIDGVVFADDGSGNTIWIAADGSVRLVDHDNANTVVRLAASFRTLLAENVDD